MSSMTIGLLSAGCIFGGALLGLLQQGLLPEGHLRDNTGDLHPSLIPAYFFAASVAVSSRRLAAGFVDPTLH
jgi:hypothetical protein